MNTMMLTMTVLMASLAVTQAGFRCTLGNWACTASCVTLGQTSGVCDGEGEADLSLVFDALRNKVRKYNHKICINPTPLSFENIK